MNPGCKINVKFSISYGICTSLVCILIWGLVLYFKEFVLWDQIVVLASGGEGLVVLDLLISGHPHSTRYLAVSPVYVLSDAVGITGEWIFGWYIGLLLFGTAKCCVAITANTGDKSGVYVQTCLLFAVLSLCACFMNGRGIMAFFGISLLAMSLVHIFNGRGARYVYMPASIVFASVSSGALMVAMGMLIFAMVISGFKCVGFGGAHWIQRVRVDKVLWSLVLSVVIIVVLFGWLLYVLIDKGLSYYDYSVIEMGSHGVGEVASDIIAIYWPILASVVMVLAICVVALFAHIVKAVLRLEGRQIVFLSIVCSSAICGVFGYTALSMCVPLLGALFTRWIVDICKDINNCKTEIMR